MPRLPRVSGREAVSVFRRAGFEVRRQRGSYIVMTKPGCPETLSVPDHREPKPAGVLGHARSNSSNCSTLRLAFRIRARRVPARSCRIVGLGRFRSGIRDLGSNKAHLKGFGR
jgi:predicted RNA binding protein YcfA (HicA-like mRNA interferase family)